MSDPPETGSNPFAGIQATLDRIDERLSSVCTDVEELKRDKHAREQAAKLPIVNNPGTVQSTTAHSAVFTPVGVTADDVNEDDVVTKLTWSEQMELADEDEGQGDSPVDRTGGDKVRLTQVHKSTEDFLRKAFNAVSNTDRRQIRQQFIVPDTPFTTAPRLDKVMAAECSKSLKSADNSLSRIQALFLDAVGPLSGLLEKVNTGTEISVDDMEGAVKAALTFIGNASSQCTSLRRTGILEEYNRDLVSFGQVYPAKASSCPTILQRRSKGPGSPLKSTDQVQMTRTSCTQIFNIKRICKPYNCSPFTTGFHEATGGSTAVISGGREVEPLSKQLGSVNNRQMGDRHSKGLSNSFYKSPSTGKLAKPSYILHRVRPSDTRVGEGSVGKGWKEAYYSQFADHYNNYGSWAVIIAGITPFPYKVITILSGFTGLNFMVFVICSILARGLRFFLIAILLWYFGEKIQNFIEERLGFFSIIFVFVLIGSFIFISLI